MISHLNGAVIAKRAAYAILSVQGVGYKVFMTGQNLSLLSEGESAELWTHLAVRETALDLYGFPSPEELSFFELLITVSGIGPKTALSILNVATITLLRQAIFTENIGHLVKVSGIGKKNAEKIVIELRGKLSGTYEEEDGVPNDSDAIEALISLGYGEKLARETLQQVPKEVTTPAERIKKALKILSA
jgi:Holliday junction DNA helicase RuvA